MIKIKPEDTLTDLETDDIELACYRGDPLGPILAGKERRLGRTMWELRRGRRARETVGVKLDVVEGWISRFDGCEDPEMHSGPSDIVLTPKEGTQLRGLLEELQGLLLASAEVKP